MSSATLALESPTAVRLMLTVDQVAAMFSLAPSTIYKLVGRGEFPKPTKIGRRAARWDSDLLGVWLDAGAPPLDAAELADTA